MSGFEFLIGAGEKPEDGLQILNVDIEVESLVRDLVENKVKCELCFNLGAVMKASSSFISVARRGDRLFLKLDQAVPLKANEILLKMKIPVAVNFQIDHIDYAFLAHPYIFNGKKKYLVVTFPKEIFRLQRRMSYRLDLDTFDAITMKHDFRNDNRVLISVKNISTGGIAFYSDSPFSSFFEEFENDEGEIEYNTDELFNVRLILFKTKIVKAQIRLIYGRNSGIRRYRFLIGAQFEQISERDLKMIGSYIFRKQKEEIRKLRRYEFK